MIAGWEITTVEGIGNRADSYNEIQQKIVQFNATQCGLCTPGMVMNMYALKESGVTKMAQIENSFGGNLCRCTGYRPILSAFKSMANDSDKMLLGIVPDIEDLQLCSKKNSCQKSNASQKPVCCNVPTIMANNTVGVEIADNWYKVSKIKDIFPIFNKNSGSTYQLVAGNTAKGVYRDMSNKDYFIDISSVAELQGYSHNTSDLVLGGNITLQETITVCQQVSEMDDDFNYLQKVALHIDLVANLPVRNVSYYFKVT